MIALIFEVWPHPGRDQDYLDAAARLRPLLGDIPGFISIERFESLSEPGKLLSLGFFANEEALTRWRTLNEHREAQAVGRSDLFRDYRIHVASVTRSYGMRERSRAPEDSRQVHGD